MARDPIFSVLDALIHSGLGDVPRTLITDDEIRRALDGEVLAVGHNWSERDLFRRKLATARRTARWRARQKQEAA